MSGWTRFEGPSAALPMDNIDTDQLIPARFMSAPRSAGYGRFLLHDLRFDANGEARDFPAVESAEIIVAGRNFGCGSSREAAVYALVDSGVRAVVAPGFGDIFAGNAVNNGLAPLRAEETLVEALLARLAGGPGVMAIDLAAGTLSLGEIEGTFALDAVWREKLVNGWDDIDLTARHRDAIAAFRAALNREAGWATPRPG